MITIKCPVRISLVGGSSDLDAYVDKHGKGSVISFTPKIYTYVSIYKDILGRNTLGQKYIVNYSQREEVSSVGEIKNDLVRLFFGKENVTPCSVHMTSDVFSHGSGLAVSSSYSCGLVKAISELKEEKTSDIECTAKAHFLEKLLNPLLGQQDVFGCGIGGFKKIEFTSQGLPKYTFLPTSFFEYYVPYLVYTGITRNSTSVLKSVTVPNTDTFNPLVSESENMIMNGNFEKFLKLIKDGWVEKKRTSKDVLADKSLQDLDAWLDKYPGCVAHKLCGAGNGGFFLCFFEKNRLPIDGNFFKVTLSNTGVERVI
jgi:D-glycero-alpha-D-manno-heptose-7-phosphate kinase